MPGRVYRSADKHNRPAAERGSLNPPPAADRKICLSSVRIPAISVQIPQNICVRRFDSVPHLFISVRIPALPLQIRGITDADGLAVILIPDVPVSQ